MNDSVRVSATLNTVAPVHVGYRTVRPALTVRCDLEDGARRWNVVLVTGAPSEDETLELRLDKAPSFEVSTSSSTDRGGHFLEGDLDSLVHQLRWAKRLTVRFTPFVAKPTVITFDLAGAGAALNQLERAGCRGKQPR